MPKRVHSDSEDDEYDDTLAKRNDASVRSTTLASLCRVLLSRQVKYLKTRREHLLAVLNKDSSKGTLKDYIQELDSELRDSLGLCLEQNGTDFLLLSCLDEKSKDVLHELLKDDTTSDLQTTESLSNKTSAPSKKRSPIVANTFENSMGSVQLIVILILVLSKNRITESDLIDALVSFGLPKRLDLNTPVFNMPSLAIIAEMTRRDYLEKSIAGGNSAGDNNNVDYSLGKRALREFKPETFSRILQELIPQAEFQDKILTSLKRCFPEHEFKAAERESDDENGDGGENGNDDQVGAEDENGVGNHEADE